MSDDLKFSWVDADADANFKIGDGSVGAKYRSDTGVKTSLNLCNIGAKVGVETLKLKKGYGDGLGELSAQGPSASGNVGVQCNHERIGLNAMAEASAAKAKASAGPAFLEANLNANTGAIVGTDGVKVGFLGFGCTLGVGGRWSFDTPVGSAGGSFNSAGSPPPTSTESIIEAITFTHTHTHMHENENFDYAFN